ncbi:hypothetical protein MLD38_028669 [Melastoma candidum]|uniref:Uncharacterized protein n=1 Tax=Melastoma candidum TaxID=119954 RepID=A0ACB9N3H5_9MYRT|nr:hypothetical protein MLD38_028669 [Melastoma candidum]
MKQKGVVCASLKVLEFYSNLNFYRDSHSLKFIRTSVNGLTLVYSALDVCNSYGCESTAETQDFEKTEAFSIIVGHKISLKNYMESPRLDLRLRVLPRGFLFSLLPRAGSIDTIMSANAKVMLHLLEGFPFGLGALIFEHMKWSLSKIEKSLPYDQVITGLLQMHGIDPTTVYVQDKWKVGNFGTPCKPEGSAPPAVEASASFALPSVLKELQLQVAAQGEDIRVLQRLVMDAIRQLEGLNKFLHENLDASADLTGVNVENF